MQLISSEVLLEAKGLSAGACGFLALVGVLLWALGWRWHRFWIVFGITTAAGVLGLNAGKAAGGHVLVIGLLLAFAGGVMALELAKILSFAAGGIGAWLAVQSVLPAAQEMWAVFLAGGLMGVILHRLWTMLLTSACGVLLSWHAGLILLEGFGLVDAAKWVTANVAAVNGAAIFVAILGIPIQSFTAEKRKPPAEEKPAKGKKPKKDDHDGEPKAAHANWWPKWAKAA